MTITLPLTWLPGSIKCGPGDTEEAELGLTWQGRQTDRWSQPMANEVKRGAVFWALGDDNLLALQEGREPDYSEYKEFKLTVENIGYQMLMKMGWKEGDGLGSEGQGIKNPVNK